MIAWVNVDRGLGPPLVAHGPGWVDQAPVGWPRDALIGPPGGPGVWLGQGREWQHKQKHPITQLHFVFHFHLSFISLFVCLENSLFFTAHSFYHLASIISEEDACVVSSTECLESISPGMCALCYECLWVVSGVPLPLALAQALASWDDVLLPQSAPIRHHPSSARPGPGPGTQYYSDVQGWTITLLYTCTEILKEYNNCF